MTASTVRRARIQTNDGKVIEGDYVDDGAVRLCDGLVTDAARFLPPSSPSKIVCVGLNYRDHPKELGMVLPSEPIIFLKPPTALGGHGSAIARPAGITKLDYEGELVVVIGTQARRVSENDALACIAGLTIGNDVTARELQTPGSQWTRAKGYDTFAQIGPCLLQSADWSGRRLETRLNGVVVQSATTDRMVFGVPELIAFITEFMTLEPGDVIMTGTPAGVGPMADGDVVEVEIEGIGILRNTVVPESSVGPGGEYPGFLSATPA